MFINFFAHILIILLNIWTPDFLLTVAGLKGAKFESSLCFGRCIVFIDLGRVSEMFSFLVLCPDGPCYW